LPEIRLPVEHPLSLILDNIRKRVKLGSPWTGISCHDAGVWHSGPDERLGKQPALWRCTRKQKVLAMSDKMYSRLYVNETKRVKSSEGFEKGRRSGDVQENKRC
jgi:hypothetical protein